MSYKPLLQKIDIEMRNNLGEFIVKLCETVFLSKKFDNATAGIRTEYNEIIEKLFEDILNNDNIDETIFQLRLIINSKQNNLLTEENASGLLLVLGAIYAATSKQFEVQKNTSIDYKTICGKILETFNNTDVIKCVICFLPEDENLINIICKKLYTMSLSSIEIMEIINPVLQLLWDNDDYNKMELLCSSCKILDTVTVNKDIFEIYGSFAVGRKYFAKKQYKDAETAIENIIKKESFAEINEIQKVLPWVYYDAALYRAWDIKNQEGETKVKSISYCQNMLDKAKCSCAVLDESSKEKIINFIDWEKEFLEMENGVSAEEDINKALTDIEKRTKSKEHYKKAFSYFWGIWEKYKTSWDDEAWKKFKKSDIVDHVWCMIKTLAYHNTTIDIDSDRQVSVDEVIECILKLYDREMGKDSQKQLHEYRAVMEYIKKLHSSEKSEDINIKVEIKLLIALLRALELLHAAGIRDCSQYCIYYYTTLPNLKYILSDEDEKSECKYRLPMFHVEHMNDPEEGCIVRDIFLKKPKYAWLTKTAQESRTIYDESYVFIKSFFSNTKNSITDVSMKEFLPMWEMYAKKATGCCVVIDPKTFSGDMRLRKVYYLNEDSELVKNESDLNKDEKLIECYLEYFKKAFEDLLDTVDQCNLKTDEMLLKVLNTILERVAYIFKRETYQYENEVRLIKYLDVESNEELDTINIISGETPKAYVYHNSQTYIKEIIMGPKVINPNDFLTFIHKQGRKMWKDTPGHISISKSNLQYR